MAWGKPGKIRIPKNPCQTKDAVGIPAEYGHNGKIRSSEKGEKRRAARPGTPARGERYPHSLGPGRIRAPVRPHRHRPAGPGRGNARRPHEMPPPGHRRPDAPRAAVRDRGRRLREPEPEPSGGGAEPARRRDRHPLRREEDLHAHGRRQAPRRGDGGAGRLQRDRDGGGGGRGAAPRPLSRPTPPSRSPARTGR